MRRLRGPRRPSELTPFWVVDGVWGAASVAVVPGDALFWALGLWFLGSLQLAAIAAMVGGMVRGRMLLALIGLGLKLGCLAAWAGLALFKGKSVPFVAWMWGIATLGVVPLIGGIVWHVKDYRFRADPDA